MLLDNKRVGFECQEGSTDRNENEKEGGNRSVIKPPCDRVTAEADSSPEKQVSVWVTK